MSPTTMLFHVPQKTSKYRSSRKLAKSKHKQLWFVVGARHDLLSAARLEHSKVDPVNEISSQLSGRVMRYFPKELEYQTLKDLDQQHQLPKI